MGWHILWLTLEIVVGVALEHFGPILFTDNVARYLFIVVGKLPLAIHSGVIAYRNRNHRAASKETFIELRDSYVDLLCSCGYFNKNVKGSELNIRLWKPKWGNFVCKELPGCCGQNWTEFGRKISIPLKKEGELDLISSTYHKNSAHLELGEGCLGDSILCELKRHNVVANPAFALAYPVPVDDKPACVILFESNRNPFDKLDRVSEKKFADIFSKLASDIYTQFNLQKSGKVG